MLARLTPTGLAVVLGVGLAALGAFGITSMLTQCNHQTQMLIVGVIGLVLGVGADSAFRRGK